MLNVRVPSEIKEALKRAADDDFGRSTSGMVVKILTEWLSDRGYLEAEPGQTLKRSSRERS